MKEIDNSLICDLKKEKIPDGYELVPGLDSLYELELAISEMENLNVDELIKRGAYFFKINEEQTYHARLCEGAPLRVDGASTKLRAFFDAYKFKTAYATHGLFPYRGKFHPQMIKALMNVIGLKKGDVVLDPMTGSGTTNVEASLIGLNSIGVDANPFCVFLSRVKLDALTLDPKNLRTFKKSPNLVLKLFGEERESSQKSSIKIMEIGSRIDSKTKEFLRLSYLDALSYARRRKGKDVKELYPSIIERYVTAIEKFDKLSKKIKIELGKGKIALGDARDLAELKSGDYNGIDDDEIDGIVTSPPYYFAIDYLENDEEQLRVMKEDLDILRRKMIGLRGSSIEEKVFNYLNDMELVFGEMSRVLKPRKYAIVVIGANAIQVQRELKDMKMDLVDEVIKKGEARNLRLVKRLIRPIEGARNIMKQEDILFFKNSKSKA